MAKKALTLIYFDMKLIYRSIKTKARIILSVTFLVLMVVAGKLIYTNIFTRSFIASKAQELWERSFPLAAKRGDILDRNNEPLTYNTPALSVAFIPNQVKDKKGVSEYLAKILDVDVTRIYQKLSKKASLLILHPEGKKLSYEDAIKIRDANFQGVYLVQDYKRVYPYQTRMSSLLGFVGIDNSGLAGVENYYNDILSGKNGTLNFVTDAKGGAFSDFESRIVAPVAGFNLSLTIDLNIQSIIENAMDKAMIKYEPEEIYALAMDPSDGSILAIGNRPTYDNNSYQDYDPSIYNRVLPVFSAFEPGSTFKAMTFAAAVNEGVIDIHNDTYYDKGYEIVAGQRIKSWKKGGHGLQTFLEVLENSSNPGFVEISRRLGKDRLYQYIKDFGFGAKTGVDIAGENKGLMFNYDNYGPLEVATTSFGQGLSSTPIQLVSAFNAVINGGKLYKPHIAEAIISASSGEVIYDYPPTMVKEVISENTSSIMREALESVVAKGSGRKAFLEGYRVGGKTGTAQIAENGVYLDGSYILSFLAAAPMTKPKITVYFAMKKPKNCVQYGGTTVGPIIQDILLQSLPYLGVKKDYSGVEREYTWMDTKTYEVPNFIGLKKSDVKSQYFKFVFEGEGTKVIDQLPKVGERIKEGKTIWIMLGE